MTDKFIKSKIQNILTESEQYSLLKLVDMCEHMVSSEKPITPEEQSVLFSYARGVFENHVDIPEAADFSIDLDEHKLRSRLSFKTEEYDVNFSIEVLATNIPGVSSVYYCLIINSNHDNTYRGSNNAVSYRFYKTHLTEHRIKNTINKYYKHRVNYFQEQLMSLRRLKHAGYEEKNSLTEFKKDYEDFKIFYNACKQLGIPKR